MASPVRPPRSSQGERGGGGCGAPASQPDVVFVRADAAGAAGAAPRPRPTPDPRTAADAALALALAAADAEEAAAAAAGPSTTASHPDDPAALFDLLDPTPDVHGLFAHFNGLYFNGALAAVSVEWAPRMTLCAGTCSFSRVPGDAPRIRLSAPLLSLRPPVDLKNVLLHEMVHAAIFLSGARGRDGPDGHGPLWMAHAARINAGRGLTSSGRAGPPVHDPVRPGGGYRVEAYHAFHAEVESFRVHHWRCAGPCGTLVKRASNRPPQPADCVRAGRRRGGGPCDGRGCWWHGHAAACGGAWTKVAGPPPRERGGGQKKRVKAEAGGAGGGGGRRRGTAVAGTGAGQASLASFFERASAGGGSVGPPPAQPAAAAPAPPPPKRSRSPSPVLVLDSDDDGDEPGEGPIIVLDD